MGNTVEQKTLFFKNSATSNALTSNFRDVSKEYTDALKNAIWINRERKEQ